MIAIISDIHGNLEALLTVAKEIKKRNINKIICLGDICGYYPNVNECIEIVKDLTDKVVIGNHDYYIINNEQCPRSNSANRCLDYQRSVLKEENISWLKSFPTNAVYFGINCVHGSWHNNLDEYITSEEYFYNKEPIGKYMASGHSHKPFIYKTKDFSYCNVGSVGQPRDEDYRASFAIFNNGEFEIIRLDYDYKKTQEEMKKVGFDEYFYKNLKYGLAIGKTCSDI